MITTRRRQAAVTVAASMFFAVACSKGGTDGSDQDGGTPGEDAGSRDPDAVGARVFDTSRVSRITIEVSEEDLATLRADADRPFGTDDFVYVPARMAFDDSSFERVGLRVKGNSSRAMAQGDSVPFKIDMNRYVAGQRLDGLTKINLHNTVNQPAAMNEYLSYGAFREFGVAASRTGWADVTLNGHSLGVYSLVEQVNDKMLGRWYDDGSADLYKPESPAGSLSYLGDTIDDYGNVGYEADNDTDHATFLRMVKTISEEDVRTWNTAIDVDSVLIYFAGNVALGNWDTYVAMGHNYYLFEASPGMMAMLPWDMNLSQGASSSICPTEQSMTIGMGSAPGGNVGGMGFNPADLPEGFVPPEGAPAFPGGGAPVGAGGDAGVPAFPGGGVAGGAGRFPGSGGAPLHDGLVGDALYFARYRELLRSFLAGPGSAVALGARIDAAAEVLGARITSAAVSELRNIVAARVAALERALETTPACPPASGTAVVR